LPGKWTYFLCLIKTFFIGGNGVYFTNPNQIQKFTVNTEAARAYKEASGRFFQVILTLVVSCRNVVPTRVVDPDPDLDPAFSSIRIRIHKIFESGSNADPDPQP
jgi:hypothetical protein